MKHFSFIFLIFGYVKACYECQQNPDQEQCENLSYCKWEQNKCQPKTQCSEFTNQTTCYQSQFAGIKCYYQDNQCKGPVQLCSDVLFAEKNFFESFFVCTALQCWPNTQLTACINKPSCKSGIYGRCSAYSQIDIPSYKIDLCLENQQTGTCKTQSYSVLQNVTSNCENLKDEYLCNSVSFCYYDSMNNICLNLDNQCTNNPQEQCKPFVKDNKVYYCYFDQNECMMKDIKLLSKVECLGNPNNFFFKDGLCQQCQLNPIYSSFIERLTILILVIITIFFI